MSGNQNFVKFRQNLRNFGKFRIFVEMKMHIRVKPSSLPAQCPPKVNKIKEGRKLESVREWIRWMQEDEHFSLPPNGRSDASH